jgi:hypothetical protein
MKTIHSIAAALIALSALSASSVFAEDVFDNTAHVQNDYLEAARGGFEVVQNDLQLRGMVAQNSASHIQSGNNTIADGAFTNASGMPMVVQNSGSNVLIQNATIVNVQFQ